MTDPSRAPGRPRDVGVPSPSSGYVRVICPGCEVEHEVDGFGDPLTPPCPAPAVGSAIGSATAWQDVADAIERSDRDQVLGPGWAGLFGTARRLAVAGVPPRASPSAVWCLVAAMVTTRSATAAPWARTLARLAGHVRCPECDVASGSPAGPSLAGSAATVAAVALPDGHAVIAAAGGEGTLRWWDPSTGLPLDGARAAGTAQILSLALVLMPPDPTPGTVEWLARLRDGRTVLAAGYADGAVRLWDPVTRTPLPTLFKRAGRPVVSMTAVDLVDQPPWHGTDLVAVFDHCAVDVWSSTAVHGSRSTMAPEARKLVAVGHQRLIGVGVSPKRLGYRRPVLLADRNGTVSMWETFGVRLGDQLPSDPAHREVVGIVVLLAADDGIAVVTASRADRSLRVWEPLRGSSELVPLDVRPRCLLAAGDVLVVGHDDGLLALSLATGRARAAGR